MSAVTIKKVESKKDLKRFIEFSYQLYKGHPYYVPDLYLDLKNTLSEKNAALEFCERQAFLAMRDGKVVGRVVAIINHKANDAWKRKSARFGWIDFIDDKEVSKALLDAVEQWGKEKGMEEVIGPLGFTDMDPEGMLYEGFEEMGTMSTSYNYPYYMEHMPPLGYEKDNDWIEYRLEVPRETGVPPRLARVADIVQEKYGLQIKKYKTTREITKNYGRELFDVLNDGMKVLYGYSLLSEKQIDQYVKMYLPVVDPKLVSLIADKNDRLIGVGICMPSLSKALQKCGGKLFPFGWWYLLKALKWKHDNHLDMLLIAVRPEWQARGVNALFFKDLLPFFISEGYDWCETSVEMETNMKVQQQWIYFERRIHKRRRCWIKKI
jgi:GNAT superfamily N-acetyltransferase